MVMLKILRSKCFTLPFLMLHTYKTKTLDRKRLSSVTKKRCPPKADTSDCFSRFKGLGIIPDIRCCSLPFHQR